MVFSVFAESWPIEGGNDGGNLEEKMVLLGT